MISIFCPNVDFNLTRGVNARETTKERGGRTFTPGKLRSFVLRNVRSCRPA